MCDLPEYTPLSQNIPPLISQIICATLQNLPSPSEHTPFSTTIVLCDPPRIYLSLPEYTPLFNKFICATSQNIPLSPRIYPPPLISQIICATLQNLPSLSEHTPLFNNYNIMRPSQNLPPPPRINPPFHSGRVAYNCLKGGCILGGEGRFWEGRLYTC